MKHTIILNTRIITSESVLPDYCIEIQDGKIAALFPNTRLQDLPKDVTVIDAHDAYAAPGLIDGHVHGFAGFGPEQCTENALLQMSDALAQVGVTAFCPTLYCGKPNHMLRVIENTVGAFGKEKGAHLIGYHLEGPFISPTKPGVMKPQDIAPVDLNILEQLYKAAKGHISAMTIAPELPAIAPVIDFCKEHRPLLEPEVEHVRLAGEVYVGLLRRLRVDLYQRRVGQAGVGDDGVGDEVLGDVHSERNRRLVAAVEVASSRLEKPQLVGYSREVHVLAWRIRLVERLESVQPRLL